MFRIFPNISLQSQTVRILSATAAQARQLAEPWSHCQIRRGEEADLENLAKSKWSQNCLFILALPHFWSRQKASIFLLFSCRQSNSPFVGAWKAKSVGVPPKRKWQAETHQWKMGFGWLMLSVPVDITKLQGFKNWGCLYKDVYVHVAHGIWCAVRASHSSMQLEACLSLTSMFLNRLRWVESSGKSSTLNIAIPFASQPIGETSETGWNEFIKNEKMCLFCSCSLVPCKSKDTETN